MNNQIKELERIQLESNQIIFNFLDSENDLKAMQVSLEKINGHIYRHQEGFLTDLAKEVYDFLEEIYLQSIPKAMWWSNFKNKRIEFAKLKNMALRQIERYLKKYYKHLETDISLPTLMALAS